MTEETLTDRKSLDEKTVQMIVRTLGPIQAAILELGRIDRSYGQARLGPNQKCVWLDDGRRVTIILVEGGGYVAGTAKTPDPEARKIG